MLQHNTRLGHHPRHGHGGTRYVRPGCACSALQRRDVYRDLFSALATQFRTESLPWIQDLVLPLIDGPPGPLTGTLDPRDLADEDGRFVRVNGVDIHYKEVTAGSGAEASPSSLSTPSLLMLHGFNGSEYNWRFVARPVAAQLASVSGDGGVCRAVAYDRPPFGLSGRPLKWELGPDTDPYTLSGGVEMARGLVETLGLGRVVVMGHSAGAPVALELAARYPDLVAGVVLVAPAVPTDDKGFLASADLGRLIRFGLTRVLLSTEGPGLNYVRRQLRRREEEVRAGNLGVHFDNEKFAAQEEVIDNYLKPMRAHDWDRASLNVFRAVSPGGARTQWGDVKAPVLVVQGDSDTAVPARAARALVQALRSTHPSGGGSVEYVELSQCGHLPMEEQPDHFTSAVCTWLAQLPPGPQAEPTGSERPSPGQRAAGQAVTAHDGAVQKAQHDSMTTMGSIGDVLHDSDPVA